MHRTFMLLLAWLILPLAAGSAFFVHRVWADEHAKVSQQIYGWSSAIVQSVELHFGHRLATLEAIAVLPDIDRGDLKGIYRFARDLVADDPGALVALVRPDGQLLLNTSVPFGDPLPNLWQIEDQQREASWQGHALPVTSQGLTREVFRTGQAGYSGLYFGLTANRPRTAIAIPVRRNGSIVYTLMLAQLATDLEAAVRSAALPPQARVALLDRKGSVIATNGVSPYSVAQKVSPAAPGPGLLDTTEDDGVATVGAYGNTAAGHTVLVSLPRADAYRTARYPAIGWGLGSVAAFILSMMGAASLNRRIAQPLRRLAGQAIAGGTPELMAPTNVHEIDLLAAALRAADRSNELRRQEHILLVETEKKQEAVASSEAQMRRVFAGLHVSVAVLDSHGRLIELNHAPARRPDSTPSVVLGRLFWDYDWWSYDPVVQQTVRESVAEARRGREAIRYNVAVRMDNGRLVMVDFQLSPLTDENGAITRMIACSVDVQDRVDAIRSLQVRAAEAREIARKLDEQQAELQEADRHKDEFLAMLGHELRNPLGPIRSAIHILRKYPTAEPVQVRAQEIIERQTKQMTRLVDDLLDLARIKQGSIRIERDSVLLQDVAGTAAEAVAPLLEAKGVRFLHQSAQEPFYVQGDATRLSQAIVNLLTNAGKFTDAGGQVTLRLHRENETAIVEVADDGIGLAPDSLERIFGLFVQVQHSGAAGNSGLGVGLALARNLLAMHGGSLVAASAGLGKGSTFTARLPLADAPLAMPMPMAPIETREKRPSRRHRLLVVDDNADACDLMRELLEMSGFDADTAYDGAKALVATQKTNHDAFVLDIGLPDMNGYELCRRIRRQAGTAPVMIALTGWGQAHDKRAAEEAGFDAHITKPADPDMLCNTLIKLLKERDAAKGPRDQAVSRLLESAAAAGLRHGLDTAHG